MRDEQGAALQTGVAGDVVSGGQLDGHGLGPCGLGFAGNCPVNVGVGGVRIGGVGEHGDCPDLEPGALLGVTDDEI